MSEANAIGLSASLEDYLEAIFQIIRQKQAVRAKDIGERLKVGRSSVTGALHALAQRELINYAPYDVITLTDKGHAAAADVVRRHEALRTFFVKVLAVAESEADTAACQMEHAIPPGILERFVAFAEFMDRCPMGRSEWIQGFGYRCAAAASPEACSTCQDDQKKTEPASGSPPMPTLPAAPATVTLASLKPGARAVIVKVIGGGPVRRRLLDMGATAGTRVEVERVAPLGDPVEVKIKGYHLTLRKEEAEHIRVEVVA